MEEERCSYKRNSRHRIHHKGYTDGLADRAEAGRKDTQELVANMGKITFKIAQKRETKDRQAELLAEIAEAKEKIQKYRDDPTITGLLNTKLSTFYQELGNSYLEESVEAMVTLTEKEMAGIECYPEPCGT